MADGTYFVYGQLRSPESIATSSILFAVLTGTVTWGLVMEFRFTTRR